MSYLCTRFSTEEWLFRGRQVREQVRDGGSFPPSAEKDITTFFLERQNKRTLCAIDIVDIVQRKGKIKESQFFGLKDKTNRKLQ